MQPRIENSPERKLVGKKLDMNFAYNRTMELWKGFMPLRNEIKNRINQDLISMQVYPDTFSFTNFDIDVVFSKWAVAEVSDFDNIPDGMESFTLAPGLYAVFAYKGLNADPAIFRYIFGEWLPASDYSLDNRPHFEVLGAKYKNNDPESEEEIWIPVKPK